MTARTTTTDVDVALLDHQLLPDVQATGDHRGVALDAVGIAGLSLPVNVLGPGGAVQPTVAGLEMTVAVPATVKGTHMSRFVEEATATGPLDPGAVVGLARRLRDRLEAPEAAVDVRFPLFVERAAPATGAVAPHRYDVQLRAAISPAGVDVEVGVTVPVTSLCPCSREISDYGAHSQRGTIELRVASPAWADDQGIWPQELFAYADEAGSAKIYPLLKRPDERAVTMGAYDAPAFVEDVARNVVVAVRADARCVRWAVAVSNEESIHAHQAVARVSGAR
jgi:GTP cyclohydrolase IB